MSTPFWFNDISILYNKNYLLEIIPLKTYDFNRKLNAILRFTIYYAILLYILKNDKNVLCLPFITVVITVFLNKTNEKSNEKNAMVGSKNVREHHSSEKVNELVKEIDEDIFRKPDIDNPMMNMNVFKLYDDKRAIPTYDNPGVERVVEEKWSDGLYRDSDDLFGKNNSQRQWYTMPNTEAMNRQTEFAKWCYMTPPTCKEGNGLQCANNIPTRYGIGKGGNDP
jgi:hypothetical protein